MLAHIKKNWFIGSVVLVVATLGGLLVWGVQRTRMAAERMESM